MHKLCQLVGRCFLKFVLCGCELKKLVILPGCLLGLGRDAAVDVILRTTKMDVESWRQNLDSLAKDVYCLTDEHIKLFEAMQ